MGVTAYLRTILIIDDDNSTRRSIKGIIEESGYEFNVVEAGNRREAFELLHALDDAALHTNSRTIVERIKEYIYKHYSAPLSVELLAREFYLSPGYMSCVFKSEVGVNVSKFISRYRLEKARELITYSNKKIVQISKEVGFSNSAYFCKSFKEHFGCTPQQYRRR
jgi:two-component system response regulator YesN